MSERNKTFDPPLESLAAWVRMEAAMKLAWSQHCAASEDEDERQDGGTYLASARWLEKAADALEHFATRSPS